MPSLSVIVPAYNRAETLGTCLQAIRASTFPDYELIVADSGSQDTTRAIAERYADRLIRLSGRPSQSRTRNHGVQAAQGDILVNIDSDVVIRPDALERIASYFACHEEVDAVTGLLAKDHPHAGFFSQYKNLYMHHTFQRLPERVTFLYGSIHAFRREAARPYGTLAPTADDLEFGQQLLVEGKRLAFVRALEVVHLKRYTWWSLIQNDFRIPFEWAHVFVRYRGWGQLGRHGTGFAHARMEQLVSVVVAPTIVLATILSVFNQRSFSWMTGVAALWLLLNLRFVVFLAKEKGVVFGFLGCFLTFLDHLIMAAGIACGLASAAIKPDRCHQARRSPRILPVNRGPTCDEGVEC